jgi:UDP-N-acetylmuramoyl-L-alanyl-D-glutamate--2,6-diaminopimelate ligase
MTTGTTHQLTDLAAAAGDLLVRVDGEAEIAGLSFDSRRTVAGDLFFCIPGARSDGHDHAAAAAAAGAAAVLVERPVAIGVPEVHVTNARRAMARVAAHFYGHPARDLQVIGVTGTNGKTTTTFLLEAVLTAAGLTPGVIGTIETRIGGVVRPGVRTTPESLDLQRLFAEMRTAGVDAVAMEVTSHALALDRVEGVEFAAAGFTNLTQDHLDFHASMEDYYAAKRALFTRGRARRGAVNVDDAYGRRLVTECEIETITFGASPGADVRAENVHLGSKGTHFVCVVDGDDLEPEKIDITSSLVGSFNVSNCLAAIATALAAGISLEDACVGVEALRAVPGRFESIDVNQPFGVVVDYAHTPDSLENVLRAARSVAAERGGRVHVIFGAGGDRDRGKRPLMGRVAAELADVVVVTSDNPRSEDPASIIAQIVAGIRSTRPHGADAVIPDRAEAIGYALHQARDSDVVVIAGKGHETGQQFADRTIPFDDRDVARRALARLGWNDDRETEGAS